MPSVWPKQDLVDNSAGGAGRRPASTRNASALARAPTSMGSPTAADQKVYSVVQSHSMFERASA